MRIVRFVVVCGLAIGGLALPAGRAAAQQAYVTCVQSQLAALGYSGIKVSGKVDGASAAAVEALRAKNAGNRGMALIPKLNEATAVSWCREIGTLNPGLRRHMPAASPPLVLSGGGSGSVQTAMLAQAFAEAERFFQSTFGIYPASRVDVTGAGSGTELAKLAVELQRQRGRSYGRMDSNVSRVCGSPSDYFGGQAYREQLLICWPYTKTFSAEWRRKTQGEVTAIMVHEYMHHIQSELANDKDINARNMGFRGKIGPAWLVEGAAEYVEYRWSTSRGGRPKLSLEQLQKSSREFRKPLGAMLDNRSVKGRSQYHISRFAVYLLASRFGERAIFDHWRYIGQGYTWEQAFERAFGMKMGAFQSAFEVYRLDATAAAAFAAGK